MQANDLNELTRILQTAISPVALVSGIGLLVLAMTSRFSHTADRARTLSKELKAAGEGEAEHITIQIKILYRRLKLLMLSIGFALASIFFISLLITSLFVIYVLNVSLQDLVIVLFVLSLVCLVTSIVLFIRDIALSLNAMKEELKGQL
jgi:hypothetical protein